MYTIEQIRQAGIDGELNSNDIEHLISILTKTNNKHNNMTQPPKDKAKELFDKFKECSSGSISKKIFIEYEKKYCKKVKMLTEVSKFARIYNAKQCALICVDEIIDALDKSLINADIEYWQQVKTEIENL